MGLSLNEAPFPPKRHTSAGVGTKILHSIDVTPPDSIILLQLQSHVITIFGGKTLLITSGCIHKYWSHMLLLL